MSQDPGPSLPEGLYESLLTQDLSDRLRALDDFETLVERVDAADQPHVLAGYLGRLAELALRGMGDPARRIELVNQVLQLIASAGDLLIDADVVRQLMAISAPPGPGQVSARGRRPSTPLSEASLLTNSAGEPSLGSELKTELSTCDRADLLCAFVKWYGLRLLEAELTELREREVPMRVITTTYLGSTDPQALDRLVRDFGAEIRVQYDAQRTRLHAKAWLFQRNTGYHTAYVGSSNLSRAALLDGVEWNVRLSAVATPTLLDKFSATFETYWNDPAFEAYDPDQDRDRLDDALAEASGRSGSSRVTISLSGLEVRPYAYQQEMLDALAAERSVHHRHRNLIVAATGTGKTVVAALDYRSLCRDGQRPTLLFVAHRAEILQQSLRTYQEVLNDASFGELWVGGSRPERWRHVFASVQSLSAHGIDLIPSDAFEVVVIDEFHHAAAPTYRRVVDHLAPQELLGLTATPERTDGTSVTSLFGGRIAAELRLWDAIGRDLLCPFHYFAIADGVDLSSVTWSRGRYDADELATLYTGNDARARLVLAALRDKILDPAGMRALGFCVSVDHAEFMALRFRDAGVSALAVSGRTPPGERAAALQDLREGRVNVLFAADLFNEGLDIPDVDTVLFLRPTESATVFLQQLGRGLRRTPNKPVLTVLDFVGHQRREFRFDLKLRALTGLSRRQLELQVERGFPFLPSGCDIVLDRQSHQAVLDNIRNQVAARQAMLVGELRRLGDTTLAGFLRESMLDLSDVVREHRSWTELRRRAGLPTRPGGERETALLRRNRSFGFVDDPLRANTYTRLLDDEPPAWSALSHVEQRLGRMLFFSLWPDGGGFSDYADGLAALRHEPAVRDELRAVVDYAFEQTRKTLIPLTGRLSDVPLQVHASYQREEVVSALGVAAIGGRRPTSFREGVLYQPELRVDALFVTLTKSEADYSPTTLYRDYPISPELFHWESQSTTTVASPTGQRYLSGTSTVLLFARQTSRNEMGTAPYLFLGPATYVSHTGEKPIAVTWRLRHRMPADFFERASLVAS